jgi:hypothetical protein
MLHVNKINIGGEKMKNRKALTIMTSFLMLTIALTISITPNIFAQEEPMTKKTFPINSVTPNPVGVNQTVLITLGITDYTAPPQMGWEGLTLEIVKPDGTSETLGPYHTDPTGLTGATYTPTMVGTYSMRVHFPEQTVTSPALGPGSTLPVGTIMLSSTSEFLDLIVQEDRVPEYPGHPIPNTYWTRPIDAQLREWSRIAGNWIWRSRMAPGGFAPGNEYAPETPHILWSKPISMGGLVGSNTGTLGFEHGDAYEGKFLDSLIIGGILYYNRFTIDSWTGHITPGVMLQQGVVAVDLRTGEELWFRNNTRIRFGQLLEYDSPNYHGVFAYLWEDKGSTWNAYDPATGEWLFSYENIPPHYFGDPIANMKPLPYDFIGVHGPNGEILRYTIDLENGWMTLWNSTKVIPGSDEFWAYLAHRQTTFDATNGIEWNVTIPKLPGIGYYILEDRIIGTNTHAALGLQQPNPVFWAISTAPGHEGQLLWNKTWTLPIEDIHVHLPHNIIPNFEDQIFLVASRETTQYWGFDIDTGEQVWGPSDPLQPMDSFTIIGCPHGMYTHSMYTDGKLVTGSYGGVEKCYDIKTGDLLWTYRVTDPYNEILWSPNWPIMNMFVTDNKVYLAHTEHSPLNPMARGAPFICLDLETGNEIFRVNGLVRTSRWGGHGIIGDSIIAMLNTYDNCIYAIGKGPSTTTVDAPMTAIPKGSSIIIRGTVMDNSAGAKQDGIAERFPNGLPAVSDEDMGDWMLHVYNQFECPDDVEGVEVVLKIQDPNGDWYQATVATDENGVFSHMWSPAVVGEYHVTAEFEGSESYYPSQATTTFGVDEAQTAEDVPSAEEIADTTVNRMPAYPTIPEIPAYLTIDLVILIIAAIVLVISLLAYMTLRKRE